MVPLSLHFKNVARTLKNRDLNHRISMNGYNLKSLNTDGNGEISFKEWSDYYTVVGIDTVHARPSFDAMDILMEMVLFRKKRRLLKNYISRKRISSRVPLCMDHWITFLAN